VHARAAAVLSLLLVMPGAGCAVTDPPAPAATQTAAAENGVDHELLEGLGLDGLSGREIVDLLEARPDERPLPMTASVREDVVLVGDDTGETAVPLPEDLFYVSVAPYAERTHDCFHHSLATCRGELVDHELEITVTDASGQVVLEDVRATGANGFAGLWLPRGIAGGTLAVTTDGRTGEVPLSTTAGSPTCVTTLQLGPAGD
jgi:hypothetical protein